MAEVSQPGGTQRYWFKGQPTAGLFKNAADRGGTQRYWFKGQPTAAIRSADTSLNNFFLLFG